MRVTHEFVSTKADSSDTTLVNPSNWNEAHIITGMPVLLASDYNFTAQTPGGSLTGGGTSNTITLDPMPEGIAVGNYLYISNGSGTAEGVPVTGVTATEVVVTCQNAHTGGWTIQSSSYGLQEAIRVAGSDQAVFVGTTFFLYGPIVVSTGTLLICSPGAQITCSGTSTSVFIVSANNVRIDGFNVTLGTWSNFLINSGSVNRLKVRNCHVTGGDVSIKITAGADLLFEANTISGFLATGIDCSTSVSINYVRVVNNYVSSVNSTSLFGGCIGLWGSHCVVSNNIVVIGGNRDQGIIFINSPGVGITDVVISNNTIIYSGSDAFEGIGIGSCTDFVISNNTIKAVVQVTVGGVYGIEINQSSRGVVQGNHMNFASPSVGVAGIAVLSSTLVTVSGNTILDWGTHAQSCAIGLTNTDNTNPASGQLSYNNVDGNSCAQLNGAAGNAGIRVDSLTGGSIHANRISNNLIALNTNTGSHGILVTNAGSAVITWLQVSDNMIDSCDTAIYLNGVNPSNSKVIDNQIAAANTQYNFSALTILQDTSNGILFASIPSNLANGSTLYITDGTIANPMASGGTGAMLKRLNGVNVGN